jgi:integrating conjugative element protein (TIGR03755 family)
MNMSLNKIALAFFLVLNTASVTSVSAADLIPEKSNYYYQLGGGSDISIPAVQTHTAITIGGDIHTNLGFSCNGFNPAISISNTINNLDNSVEGLSKSVIESATVAVGSLPMYALEKADPELYNLIQNAMSGAQETFNVSMKSCHQALAQIGKGQNPYQNWFGISDSQGWLTHAQAATQPNNNEDINAAQNDIVKNGVGYYGVPWVHKGQNSGGTQPGQIPITVINDVAIAGYNILIDPTRALDSNAAPSAGQNTALTQYWSSPEVAGQWAALVLGDMTITAQPSDQAQTTQAGIGLTALMSACPAIGNTQLTCTQTLQTALTQLVQDNDIATPEQLRSVSASNLVITQQVLNALRNQDSDEQAISIAKLAQEVAIQNTMDEALLMRRILMAGGQAQAVLNVGAATKMVDKALTDLDKDIQNLLFEHQVRKDMLTNSLQTVLSSQTAKEANAINETTQGQTLPLHQGAVYLNN